MNIEEIILETSSTDQDWYIRLQVAKNENTSAETLEKLANDENWLVRETVAKNENTSLKALMKLINDESKSVKEFAKNSIKKRNTK